MTDTQITPDPAADTGPADRLERVVSDLQSLHDDLDFNHPGCDCDDMAFWDTDETADKDRAKDHAIWCPVYMMWRLSKLLAQYR